MDITLTDPVTGESIVLHIEYAGDMLNLTPKGVEFGHQVTIEYYDSEWRVLVYEPGTDNEPEIIKVM